MSQYVKIIGDELLHYGVPGMKWGKRKSSYSSTELSDRQKRKAGKQYKRQASKLAQEIATNRTKLTVDAYNKTAEEYNNGKIDAYNKKHSPKSKDYDEGLEKQFNKDFSKNLNKMQLDNIYKSPNYAKSQAIVKKYDMMKYDDLVKKNAEFIKYLEQDS